MVAKVEMGMVTPTASDVMNNKVEPAKPAATPKPATKAAAPTPAPAAPAATPAPAPAAPRAPGSPPVKPERRVKMTRLRMRVAERLKGAQNTYAMLTTFNEVDMTSLMEMRNSYKVRFGYEEVDQGGVRGIDDTPLR